MKTINALAARSRLGTILDEVSQDHIHYVIERLSKPLVVVVPFSEYHEVFKQKNSQNDKDTLFQAINAFQKNYGKQLAGTKGTLDLIQSMRNGRTEQITTRAK